MNDKFYDINDDVLVKYLLLESTKAENIAVVEWMAYDVANKKYFDDFKLIWDESQQFATTSNFNEEVAWQKFQHRINTSTTKAPVKSINPFYWLKVAAMLIVIAGAAIFAYKIFDNKEIQTLAVNSLDKVVIDTLADMSVITLNKNSTLSYPEKFEGNTRTVDLEGEAFFNISPDKTKPFIIHVNDVTVKVVGTSFNIKSINGNTEVIVESGTVQVIRMNKEIELYPEEKIIVKKDDPLLVKEIEVGTLYNYYRTQEFECHNTPLWKLVDILNQAYDVSITIERKELSNLPITTTFNNESLDNILEIIRQTFNISVTKTGSQVILK